MDRPLKWRESPRTSTSLLRAGIPDCEGRSPCPCRQAVNNVLKIVDRNKDIVIVERSMNSESEKSVEEDSEDFTK